MEITRRYRVNVGTSVKGVKTFDCTVEVTGQVSIPGEEPPTTPDNLKRIALEESDALVAELDKRYPAPKE